MKNRKFFTILIVMLAMILLVGCGRNDSVAETAAPVVSTEPAKPAEPAVSPEAEAATVLQPEPVAQPATETAATPQPEPVTQPATETVIVPSVQPENTVSVQTSSPAQGSASGRFTGVQGTEFVVPEGFIQLDESPNIGYQYTFWHPDYEIRIVVYEIAPGYIPEGAYETDYSIAERNPDVTYFNHGDNWFVQSGYNNNGEEIFYSKERSTDTGLKTFWITYPTAKREFGDKITTEFEANFSF